MGSSFGKTDSSATNDLDANGNIVATGTGVKTVSDPNQGLSDQQMRAHKAAASGIRGLGAAISSVDSSVNTGSQPTSINFANNQPQFQPPQPPNVNYMPPMPKQKNPFFGY